MARADAMQALVVDFPTPPLDDAKVRIMKPLNKRNCANMDLGKLVFVQIKVSVFVQSAKSFFARQPGCRMAQVRSRSFLPLGI
jgi:hypothetical protein